MSQESMIYAQLRPVIDETCAALQLDPSKFRFAELASYSSIYYGSVLLFRVRCRGGKHYFAVSSKARDLIPEDLGPYTVKADNMVRLPIEEGELPPEILSLIHPIIEEVVRQQGKDFDCCARFEECSDARECVRTDFRSYQCGYRQILREGRIFFGKNRNV